MDLESELDLLVRRRIEESIAAKCALLQDRELIRLVVDVAQLWTSALRGGCTIFLFGNGGSAADAEHIATELVGRYQRHRPGLRAMALTANTASVTAIANDYAFDAVFARQLEALGSAGDVAVGISTSGNSPNVLLAVETARQRGMMTVGLCGRSGGKLKDRVDRCICVPSDETPRVQECHVLIGHILCEIVELEMSDP